MSSSRASAPVRVPWWPCHLHLPAIYILQSKYPVMTTSFFNMFLASAGWRVGHLVPHPLPQVFCERHAGKYPFPEATATTQVLVSVPRVATSQAPAAGRYHRRLYDFFVSSFGWWNENFTIASSVPTGAGRQGQAGVQDQHSAAVLVWLYRGRATPCLSVWGRWPYGGSSCRAWPCSSRPVLNAWDPTITATVGEMSPEAIFRAYARSIGIAASPWPASLASSRAGHHPQRGESWLPRS
jgi:hypothetical protein